MRQAKEPLGWKKWLKAAGIVAKDRHDGMPVRWHDLRHTRGVSLISGWWGRKWRLEEIQKLLGHSDISVTERYAQLVDEALEEAATEADEQRTESLAQVSEDDEDSRPVMIRR